jgi:hypothetical protein
MLPHSKHRFSMDRETSPSFLEDGSRWRMGYIAGTERRRRAHCAVNQKGGRQRLSENLHPLLEARVRALLFPQFRRHKANFPQRVDVARQFLPAARELTCELSSKPSELNSPWTLKKSLAHPIKCRSASHRGNRKYRRVATSLADRLLPGRVRAETGTLWKSHPRC